MGRRFRCTLTILAVGLSLTACVTRLGDLTVASTQNIRVGTFDSSSGDYTEVQEKDCRHIILFVPFGGANIETAMDKALAAGNGNFMTDAVVESYYWYFLYGQTCYRVRGKVWNVQLASMDADALQQAAHFDNPGVVVRYRDTSSQTGELLAWAKHELAIQLERTGEVVLIDRDETTGVYLAEDEEDLQQ